MSGDMVGIDDDLCYFWQEVYLKVVTIQYKHNVKKKDYDMDASEAAELYADVAVEQLKCRILDSRFSLSEPEQEPTAPAQVPSSPSGTAPQCDGCRSTCCQASSEEGAGTVG